MSNPITDGSSLSGTSVQALSAAISGGRSCAIQITNHSYYESLIDPNTYSFHGYSFAPPQPTIQPRTRDACSFSKAADGATGAVGVVSYRLGKDSNKRIAIMYSVPYDFNVYDSWFTLKFMNASSPTDLALYNEMYYNSETVHMKRAKARDGTTLSLSEDGYTVSATMTAATAAIIQVEILKEGEQPVATYAVQQGEAFSGQPGVTYTVTERTVVYD